MVKRWRAAVALLAALAGVASASWAQSPAPQILRDEARGRDVPLWVDEPAACTAASPCPVVLLSPGWGIPATGYRFLVDGLVRAGFAVVAVQDQLPTDAPMPNTGDLHRDRTPFWQRGAATLRFVHGTLVSHRPELDARRVVLLGHSHGGDVSATLAAQRPGWVTALVTLDHRRVSLPAAGAGLRVLSLRGSDFPADPGVLPAEPTAGACLLPLAPARHDDMHDGGPAELKARLLGAVVDFLAQGRCAR